MQRTALYVCSHFGGSIATAALYGGYSAVVNPYSRAIPAIPAMGEKYREDRPRSDIIMTVIIASFFCLLG